MQEFEVPNPRFRERIEKKLEGQAFMEHVGIEVTRIEAGLVEAVLEIRDFHKQQFGRVHGGVSGTIADIAAGFAVYTLAPADKDVVNVDLDLNYLRPGFGDRLRAVGRVIRPGRTVSYAEAEVYVRHEGKEKLILKATTNMALIPRVEAFEQD